MSYATAFSSDYTTARSRFRELAIARLSHLEAYPINHKAPNGEELIIDVAKLGDLHARKAVIVSSGLHGVEGFFGSAVQCTLLENLDSYPQGTTLILLHALNPYGFAWRRRCNEDNIDLNRNFLLPGEAYIGSPKEYSDLNSLINPTSPPSRFDAFIFKAIAFILRHGMTSIKNTLPVGQYDFPQGLFFGGNSPAQTHQILAANLPRWVGNATEVLHIDLHTGLGRKGTYKLLVDAPESERFQWLAANFGNNVESITASGTAYTIRGGFGTWCKAKFPECNYNFLTAEFGTYSMIQVIAALRAENRVHFWGV